MPDLSGVSRNVGSVARGSDAPVVLRAVPRTEQHLPRIDGFAPSMSARAACCFSSCAAARSRPCRPVGLRPSQCLGQPRKRLLRAVTPQLAGERF